MSNKVVELNNTKKFNRGLGKPKARIIAVAGGKGGIGKSFVSSSLSIFLANMGHKVLAVDLDLGCANLHTSLGVAPPPKGLQDFILKPELNLIDIMHPTSFAGLSLIGGNNSINDVTHLNIPQKSRLMSSIYHADADFVILDLSAGTHESTIDFFLMATDKIIVTTPEPSSIENAYRFMKASFFKFIKRYEYQYELSPIIAELMTQQKKLGIRSPSDLITRLFKEEENLSLKQQIDQFQFNIVLNQCRSYKDIGLGHSIKSVSQKYFGLPTEFLGHLDYDNAVWQSLRSRKHLLVEYPHSQLYTQLMQLSRKLAQTEIRRVAS